MNVHPDCLYANPACPPYHLAVVIGGLSAEQNLKAVKLASTKWGYCIALGSHVAFTSAKFTPYRYYDSLHTTGNEHGRAFRDREWEERLLKITQNLGIGAQFGGT